MKGIGKLLVWSILGVVFGTAVGIVRRNLPFGGVTDALFAGMIAAPSMVMVLLLMDYIRELVGWAIGGFVIGAALLYVVANFTEDTVGVEVDSVVRRTLYGGIIGAVAMTWLGAGWSVFRGSNSGIIVLLFALIIGAFFGVLVHSLGQSIGGKGYSFELLGAFIAWRLGESVAGIPIGILSGAVVTQYLFPSEVQ